MNIPKTIKTTLCLYKAPYTGDHKWTSAMDMEAYGWELLATKEIEIETPEIDEQALLKAKRESLEEQRQKVLESKEVEIAAIDDHLAVLAKI